MNINYRRNTSSQMTTNYLSLLNKNERLVIGLISGTSKDGIDAALVNLKGSGTDTMLNLLGFTAVPYRAEVRKRLDNLPAKCSVEEVSELNFILGEAFAEAALTVADQSDVAIDQVDLIGSHGQTVFHNPPSYKSGVASTLQLGETSIIAERTGVTTVGDFRTRDMAAGGEAAPLVPYFDYVFFSDNEKVKIAQNIGGIGNATVVTENIGDVIAFDTGPGNMLMDRVISIATGGQESFDMDGKLASKGALDTDLLNILLLDPYYNITPPKSTGEELFGSDKAEELYSMVKEGKVILPDLIKTLLMLTVETIALSYEKFIFPKWTVDEIIFGGGGCKNPVLMDGLKERLNGYKCSTTDDYGIPAEAKEAAAFAVLANEIISGNETNIPGATGARRRVPMGKIVPGSL